MKKIVSLMLMLALLCTSAGAAGIVLPGVEAPDFEVTLIDGETFRLSEQRGKVVLLNIWATWCGPCVAEMPDIDRLAGDYADELVVIGVNCGEPEEVVAEFVEQNGYGYLFAADPAYEISGTLYPSYSIPYTVIIDPDGKVHQVINGGGRDMYAVFEQYVLDAMDVFSPGYDILA